MGPCRRGEGLEKDPFLVARLVQQAKSGATRRFWIKDGLWITRGNCLYVPKVGDFWKEILRECHAAGHPRRTLAQLARGDYWPKMRKRFKGM